MNKISLQLCNAEEASKASIFQLHRLMFLFYRISKRPIQLLANGLQNSAMNVAKIFDKAKRKIKSLNLEQES